MDLSVYRRALEQEVEAKRAVPILKRRALYLVTYGTRGGRAFARRFREVWRKLSKQDRDTIIAYWERECSPGRPVIEYHDGWIVRVAESAGQAAQCGKHLRFNPRVLRGLGDQNVRHVIVHVLGHVYLWATGRRRQIAENGVEGEVNRVVEMWGCVADPEQKVKLRSCEAPGSGFKRYYNDFPRGGPFLKDSGDVTALVGAIEAAVRRFHGRRRFRSMVYAWCAEHRRERAAQVDFEQHQDEHALRIKTDPRLQDKSAGPPGNGWEWRGLGLPRDSNGNLPQPLVIGGWVPPELLDEPEAPFPIPLPDCEITLAEKYAVLAAIHDSLSRGTTKLGPPEGKQSADGRVFEELVSYVPAIPESDGPSLRVILQEVQQDLRVWADTASAGTDGDQGPREITVAKLRELTGLTSRSLNRYARGAGVTPPARGQRNHRYSVNEAIRIVEAILASGTEDSVRAACRQALDWLQKSKRYRQ